MNEQYEVWGKLIKFEFPKGFKERLAKEKGWDASFTEDAMNEYLKFMFLTKFADHGVTPSEIVDEVWHLHLIYSASYWDDLCDRILHKKVHHTPGTGDDGDVYQKQYIKTLESYKTAFGKPDSRYWATPKVQESRAEVKKSFMERFFPKRSETKYAESNNNTSTNNVASSCAAVFGDSGGSSNHENSHCGSNHGGGSHCSSGGDSGGSSGGSSCSSGGSSCGSSCGGGCGGG